MPFHIVDVETQEPYGNPPLVFPTGSNAAANADDATRITGRKYKPKRIAADPAAWKAREKERFLSGAYTKLPWHGQSWWKGSIGETQHFAHVSRNKDGMVAFTESDEKGDADQQTRIKPGVYLQRFYADLLSKQQIKDWSGEFAGQFEDGKLLFATTKEEMERVYRRGPRSCMTESKGRYLSNPHHPVHAYAAGDLAVAYIERGGSISARALCWPEKKLYGRVYGDLARITPLFKKEGYKQGSLAGAKLLRIDMKYDGREAVVCPFIDGDGGVTIEKDHLLIGGNRPAGSQNGIIFLPLGIECRRCGSDGWKASQMTTPVDRTDLSYCPSCRSRLHLCAASGNRYADRDNVVLVNVSGLDVWWNREHFAQNGFRCEWSDNRYPNSERVEVKRSAVVMAVARRHTFECKHCKSHFLRDHHRRENVTALTCNGCEKDHPLPQPKQKSLSEEIPF